MEGVKFPLPDLMKILCSGCGRESIEFFGGLNPGWFCKDCYNPPKLRDSLFIPTGNPYSPKETNAYVKYLENLRVADDGKSCERIKTATGRFRA